MEATIITGLFTLAAALGGVWLTQRHSARLAEADRSDSRRADQRRLLADVLVVARQKIEKFELILLMLPKFTDQDDYEFVNSDEGRDLITLNAELDRTLVVARLYVDDPGLVAPLRKLSEYNEGFSEGAVGPARAARGPTTDRDSKVMEALRYLDAMRRAVNDLEDTAARVLSTSALTTNGPPRGRLGRFRFWKRRQTTTPPL